MNSFVIILLSLITGVISRLVYCFTSAVGKRTTPLGRFFLDFAWTAVAPVLLFLIVFLFNRGAFIIHLPLFIALGYCVTHIVVGMISKKHKPMVENEQRVANNE
ncbi:MAG: hypothetical protein FWC80_04525 [Firmicutes bacterium]|nr:hypothetical protein [Bacillota bacterium]